MSGILYVTGTPIGNLEDITLRQLRILEEVDFIAAEDTRVTRKLLTHFELKTPLVSYHDHSGIAAAQAIADRIAAGENCAIVTDAACPASPTRARIWSESVGNEASACRQCRGRVPL